ncbi:MAG: hypothetical protein H6739_00690 [Alphaproteobacteria bacterium]|nr:hypothetical protein [Alphaproteobacteria bacterium]
MLFGVSMVGILGFAALAVDVSYLRLSALQAQNAADAGAHAAMVAYRSTLDESQSTTVAEAVVGMNMIAGNQVTLDTTNDIEFGGWDYDDPSPTFDPTLPFVNAAQVTVRRTNASTDGPVNLLLAPIFGHDTGNVVADAVGALRFREVVLAFDITPSMKDDFAEAQQAALNFLDQMYRGGAAWPGDQIGMVAYVGEAVVYTPLDYVDTAYGTISTDWLTNLNWCNQDYPPWPAAAGGAYYNVAPAMPDCTHPDDPGMYPNPSGTNPGDAIALATSELIGLGTSSSLKNIVLLTDDFVECPADTRPCTEGNLTLNAWLQANTASNNNISIHTVFLDNGSSASAAAEIWVASLARGYGTVNSTADSTDLTDILDDIVSMIPVALVN